MFGRRILILFLLAGLLLGADACRRSDRGPELMRLARQAADRQQYQQAKLYLDTLRQTCADAPDRLKAGRRMLHEIELAEQQRTCAYCDSLLAVRQAAFPALQRDFVFQQNKDMESVGYYVHRRQQLNQNHSRTYLQTKVDERGRLVLTSYYCGTSRLEHRQVRLTAPDGSYSETAVILPDGALNYTFNDGGLIYEAIRFDESKAGHLVDFALMHRGEDLQATLIGGRRNLSYPVRPADIDALAGACELSATLSDISRLLDEIRLAQAKILWLSQRTASAE